MSLPITKRPKILLFLISGDRVMAALFARFAQALSIVSRSDLITISELHSNSGVKSAIRHFSDSYFVTIKWMLPLAIVKNLLWIAKSVLFTNSGAQLCELAKDCIPIGKHIYDSMLRRGGLATIGKLDLKQKFFLFIEISYYLATISLVKEYRPQIVILPDNTYRQGPLFEYLQKVWQGDLYVGIDMNSLTVHRYKCPVQIPRHCRTPSLNLIERMEANPNLVMGAKSYFTTRKQGKHAQHDAIRAYSPSKQVINRNSLRTKYGFVDDKKIVLVMAHIFSDAPHCLPDTLYQDYQEWLIKTCMALQSNPCVNFIVKEHPSSALYGEEGMIEKILSEHSFEGRLLDRNVNTASLFEVVDYIVTCGGTAAMEFAAEGVPVVVASKPYYWELGFCYVANDRIQYENILQHLEEVSPLDSKARLRALLALYAINCLYGLDRNRAGCGTQDIFKGSEFSEEKFLKELAVSGPGSPQFSYLVDSLKMFYISEETNLIGSVI